MIILPLLVGPIFALAGLALWLKPPKKINPIYGYRTKRSMSSQLKWDFAQVYSGKLLLRFGLAYTATAILSLTKLDIPEIAGVGLYLGLMILGIVLVIRRVELELKKLD